MFPEKLSKQQGFSIVELMIAIALGIVLTGAAIQFMISSSQTYNVNDDLSRVQENGRVAMDILAKSIRLAGYRDNPRHPDGYPSAILTACVHDINNANMPCATEGVSSDSDNLPLQFGSSNFTNTDCLGGSPDTIGDTVVNNYSIQDPEGDGINSLYCSGFNVTDGQQISAPQPLVDGIDRMQVLYRVENGNNHTYKSADRLTTNDLARITAIRIGLLVSNGQTTGRAAPQSRSYQVLDSPATYDVPNDTQVRRIYTTTIQLNNRHAGT